jgi:hypothetical protein
MVYTRQAARPTHLRLLTLRPFLLHPFTSHQLSCLLLDPAETGLLWIPVGACLFHGVDAGLFVLFPGGLPGLGAGNAADGSLWEGGGLEGVHLEVEGGELRGD